MSIKTLQVEVPDHVPAKLVWDHDFDAFTNELGDPFLAGGRLHDGPGIIWATNAFRNQPAWILTRHAFIQEAFIDYEHFTSCRVRKGLEAEVMDSGWRLLPLELDPPEHHKYRNILNPYFTPRSVRDLEGPVQEACDSLITRFEHKDGCEFIGEFGEHFPNNVFLSMMGMPLEMRPQFLEWEGQLLRGTDEAQRAEASQAIFRYLLGFVAGQRANPQTQLMKVILSGQVDGRPLNDLEILGTCFLLYIGGLDTVYSALGWIFRHLATDQPLQERLRANPDDIPAAVDEFMRAFAVATPHRTVAKDFAFHGVPMRKGEDVLLPTYLAARDPRAYDNPNVIDIDRHPRHITFATGPHVCLGLHLAKREIRIVLEAFLSRFRNIRVLAGESYEYHVGGVLGVERLPLEWDRIG